MPKIASYSFEQLLLIPWETSEKSSNKYKILFLKKVDISEGFFSVSPKTSLHELIG